MYITHDIAAQISPLFNHVIKEPWAGLRTWDGSLFPNRYNIVSSAQNNFPIPMFDELFVFPFLSVLYVQGVLIKDNIVFYLWS